MNGKSTATISVVQTQYKLLSGSTPESSGPSTRCCFAPAILILTELPN